MVELKLLFLIIRNYAHKIFNYLNLKFFLVSQVSGETFLVNLSTKCLNVYNNLSLLTSVILVGLDQSLTIFTSTRSTKIL